MASISEEEIRTLVASGEFDARWYVQEYPDVPLSGLSAEEHYLWIGRTLNRRGKPKSLLNLPSPLHWCVMTTPHTLFLANMIAANLRRHGWTVDVLTAAPDDFHHDYYVVLCAQMFERLPPGERLICFQLEQSVSSRWFGPDYLGILENCSAVIDYSINNLEFLAKKGIVYPQTFYLPIGACGDYYNSGAVDKKYDILFYGDYKSSARRRHLLQNLTGRYNVKVVDEVFGYEMYSLIKRSRFVLNIHYYEGALLETPRIQECLSLGTPVISEATGDMSDYPYLTGAVNFFSEGSSEDMVRVVDQALAAKQNINAVKASVEFSQRNFEFMFDRLLVARDFIPLHKIDEVELPDILGARIVGLSLPETVHRRRIFEAEAIRDCAVFDGMRKSPGWVGCGLSYKVLCAAALRQGKKQLVVVEDDVVLDEQFEQDFSKVQRYLQAIEGDWDIFSGVIASLHDATKVLRVEKFEGIDFMTVDKMTSMVFNIYGERAMKLIADWSPLNSDVENNTIDRYLEHADLKVVVAHPFIAGHREEVHSTLWGFQNTQYSDMIQESQNRLGTLKGAWLASRTAELEHVLA